jgi:uncharacterized protein YbjT (DUF2867 family)
MSTELGTILVLGGTGFLGHRIVRRLLERGYTVRVASRHPEQSRRMFPERSALELIRVDVNDDGSVLEAVQETFAVINAVSLYTEHGSETFNAVHVAGAGRVATHARHSHVERLVHVSGIGVDATSTSPYIRSRRQGESAVRRGFPAATIIRPSVMFGPDDGFLQPIAALLRRVPIFPIFGRGETVLQPSHVEDVAEATVRSLDAEGRVIYELGGPRVYSYKELLALIGEHVGSRPLLLPVPFVMWRPKRISSSMFGKSSPSRFPMAVARTYGA